MTFETSRNGATWGHLAAFSRQIVDLLQKRKLIYGLAVATATLFLLSRCDRTLPDDIVGVWVRVDDRYAGMIMEFADKREHEGEGILIHVSGEAYEGGFRIGDVKVKGIEEADDGSYECDSLTKTTSFGAVADAWYIRDVIYIRDGNDGKELVMRQKKGSDMSVGEWQRWVNLEDAEDHLGNYHRGKGLLAEMAGEDKEAIRQYEKAVKTDPENALFLNSLAWRLAVSKEKRLCDGEEAVELAEKACELTDHANADYLDTLAAAHARDGEFERAVEIQNAACTAAEPPTAAFLGRLQLYRQKTAYEDGMELPDFVGQAPSARRTSGAAPD